jgi:hypothetical protein
MTRLLPTFALLTILSGCVPYRYTVTPHLAGRIVDATSNHALSGATVSVSSAHGGIYHRSKTFQTDKSGTFDVPALKAWGVFIVPQEACWPSATLHIEAAGYPPYHEEGLGSPASRRGGNTRPLGAFQYGRTGPDLQNLHISLRKL